MRTAVDAHHRRLPRLLAILLAGGAIGAASPRALGDDLSFEAARALLATRADTIKAAQANLQRQEFEVTAADRLGYPELMLNATQVYGRKKFDLSALPIGVDVYNYDFDGPRSSLLMTWPLYTGGKIDAVQKLREAELTGARAELAQTGERLDFQLVARYFGLRLANVVEGLRQSQLEQADRQLARSRRFETMGQVSAVERLSAQVSRDESARDLVKARRERESAEAALARMLREAGVPRPTSPLFVLTSPIEPLAVWLSEAEVRNPTLALIKSKGQAADQGIAVAKSDRMPQVFAFGQYNLITKHLTPIEPNWIAGIGVNLKLFGREDHAATIGAAQARKAQVDALEAEAVNAIRGSVETAWLRVGQAREQFQLFDSAVELGRENLRLRERAFEEGQSVTLDVNEARNSLTRAETGRAQVAYEFVVALGALLEASGQIGRFPEFMKRAEVRL
ncbi:MAG: TolC family protein [Betaproteobacteria bacterium]|nr:TolC family protein [Betaproteobacteria bacterium]